MTTTSTMIPKVGVSTTPGVRLSDTGHKLTPLTRSQLLQNIASTIRAFPARTFKTLRNVEGNVHALRATLLTGTVFELVAMAAESNGTPIGDQTKPVGQRTVADLMDNKALNFTQSELNRVGCFCSINSDEMTSERAARNLENLASKAAG